MTAASLKNIAEIYQNKVWKLHRVPWKILTNKGPQFASKFIEDLINALKTKRILSIVYHSQTNRQTKQINQEVKAFL